MKKFLFALAAAAFIAAPFFSLEVPQLESPVMDLAGIMTQKGRADLQEYLLAIDQNSAAQIAVLTIPSLEGESLEEYAIKVAREWQLGDAESNMGVLLLVAFKEKKIRIETGYGAEGDLTDAKCGLIIRNIMAPDFKDGAYSNGITAGAKAIASVLAPEAAGGELSLGDDDDDFDFPAAAALSLFFILYFVMFSGSMATKFSFLSWLPWASWFIRHAGKGGSGSSSSSFYFGSSGSSDFGGGGGFSGGGGGFGGGGASGGW